MIVCGWSTPRCSTSGCTGDAAVLDEPVPFLERRVLNPGEDEAYERPTVSPHQASLYEHCVRAVTVSLATGAHALPLIGDRRLERRHEPRRPRRAAAKASGSAWFLTAVLRPFADVAAERGEIARSREYREHADRLVQAAEEAWDGAWYRRAYFDDGTPLGSRINEECQIDAIAQSWAVIAQGDVAACPPCHGLHRSACWSSLLIRWCCCSRRPLITWCRARLHPGIPAGRARERRTIHARRDLDGAGVRASSARAIGPWSCSRC